MSPEMFRNNKFVNEKMFEFILKFEFFLVFIFEAEHRVIELFNRLCFLKFKTEFKDKKIIMITFRNKSKQLLR